MLFVKLLNCNMLGSEIHKLSQRCVDDFESSVFNQQICSSPKREDKDIVAMFNFNGDEEEEFPDDGDKRGQVTPCLN